MKLLIIVAVFCLNEGKVLAIVCFGQMQSMAQTTEHGQLSPNGDVDVDEFDACIIGILARNTGEGTGYVIFTTGTELLYHYNTERSNYYCYQGHLALKDKHRERWVRNFRCDERFYPIAYLCTTDLCNTVENSKLSVFQKANTTDGVTICPSDDFISDPPKETIDGQKLAQRRYVRSCYTSVDERQGITWGIELDDHDFEADVSMVRAHACIIGYTRGRLQKSKTDYFRQAYVYDVTCEYGLQQLGSKTGLTLKTFECDDDYWISAYICREDNCNMDAGCNGITMQYTGRASRTCTPLLPEDCPKDERD